MKIENNYEKKFQEKLSKQLYDHRQKRKLSQYEVANAVGKTAETYQRWESSGKHLTDIFSLLSVFKVLDFSTAEIIDVFGLPPLTLSEIKDIYQDKDILDIKRNGIYSAMRKKCPEIDDFTLGKLLHLLMEEHIKRWESR